MSFYVTLPSHGADTTSEYGKATNKQNDFTINLKKSINLPIDRYEVALVEMSFKNFWLINLGKFILKDEDDNVLFNEDIFIYDGLKIKEVCRYLNNKFHNIDGNIHKDTVEMYKRNELKNPSSDVKSLLTNFDLRAVNFVCLEENIISVYIPDGFELTVFGLFPQLIYRRIEDNDDFDQRPTDVDHEEDDVRIEINQLLERVKRARIIKQENLDSITFIGNSHKSCRLVFNYNSLKIIQSLFVYTNIIESSHVGENMAKLLRVVQVSNDFDNVSGVIFDEGHYISLDNDYIDHIRMIVKDSTGESIKFLDNLTPVTYKLHFRPKK